MSVEVCTYRVSLRGKTIGGQTLRTYTTTQEVRLEARLELWGSWSEQTITQQSQLVRPSLCSRRFSEETHDRGGKRLFEVDFDAEAGLVRASRGPRDKAETPYTRDYQDPLGLLYQLRHTSAEVSGTLRIPMLGKDVVVEVRPTTTVDTVLGTTDARVLVLYPGASYLYVSVQPPYPIVAMTQRLDYQFVEVLLVKREEEAGGLEPDTPKRRPSTRRRRVKRRRSR